MKRFLILSCLCLAFPSLRGQGVSSTNAAPASRAGCRFVFLIDTSSAMSRQKDQTLDSVSRLILSGVGGRIQSGDVWSLWTMDDKLHTDFIPPQRWDPQQRGDVANRLYRALRDQRFSKKKPPLDKALAAVAEEAKISGTLTAFLFTDGSVPIKGTPFDEQINEIFTKHAAGMRKAKKPFVTVLVAQEGRFAAHAVSPAGERIYIPRLPEAATAKQSDAKDNATGAVPAPAKTLTAEEISELLRQAQKRQSNTVVVTPAPLIIRGTAPQTNQVPTDAAARPGVETIARPAVDSAPAPEATVSPDRSATVSATPPAIAPPSPVKAEAAAPTGANAAAAVAPSDSSRSQPNRPLVSSTETGASDPGEPPAHSAGAAQAAVLAQQEPLANTPIYLIAAVAMLFAAMIFAWLYLRGIRYVPRPSLISQSLEKEKK